MLMKEAVLTIRDEKYFACMDQVKSKFPDFPIQEKSKTKEELQIESSNYEILLMAEKSVIGDWLSDNDNRWDDVL